MGAEFHFESLVADDYEEAVAGVESITEQCYYDYGHSGYTGTFAEADGVKQEPVKPDNEEEVYEWINENAEKWGPVLIVQDKEGNYYAGAWCSS